MSRINELMPWAYVVPQASRAVARKHRLHSSFTRLHISAGLIDTGVAGVGGPRKAIDHKFNVICI